MQVVRRISKLLFVLLLMNCKYNNQLDNKISQNAQILSKNIIFNDYGNMEVGMDWEEHKLDSVLYFNVLFKNITDKKVTFKTNLVATDIPFLLIYNKNKNKINFNIIHQFNTIYLDSMLLDIDKKGNIYIDKYYFVAYPKNQDIDVSEVKLIQKVDTIFIER